MMPYAVIVFKSTDLGAERFPIIFKFFRCQFSFKIDVIGENSSGRVEFIGELSKGTLGVIVSRE